jgi:hypothetical protein
MDEGRLPRPVFLSRISIHKRNSGKYYMGLFSAHTIIFKPCAQKYGSKKESNSKAR